MLRVTEETTNQITTLRLEGKFQGPWVEIVRHDAGRARVGGQLQLDLSGVTYIDRYGIALLKEVSASGVRIVHCSRFVRELLKLEGLTS